MEQNPVDRGVCYLLLTRHFFSVHHGYGYGYHKREAEAEADAHGYEYEKVTKTICKKTPITEEVS